jgi:signal transduction histidine kinase
MADGALLLLRAFMNILVNIIVNGIRAMPEDGLPDVGTSLDPGGAGVPASLVFRVTDTGPGNTPDALESLFRPFFTTRTRGTGLVLVLVRNVVECHGGRPVLRGVEEARRSMPKGT